MIEPNRYTGARVATESYSSLVFDYTKSDDQNVCEILRDAVSPHTRKTAPRLTFLPPNLAGDNNGRNFGLPTVSDRLFRMDKTQSLIAKLQTLRASLVRRPLISSLRRERKKCTPSELVRTVYIIHYIEQDRIYSVLIVKSSACRGLPVVP